MESSLCFGLKNNKCAVLYEPTCRGKDCPFYKTRAQFVKDKKKYSKQVKVKYNCDDILIL